MVLTNILKNKAFDFSLFLNELDREHLMYLHYLTLCGDEEILEFTEFFKKLKKGRELKKIPTIKLVNELMEVYNKKNYKHNVLSAIYESEIKPENLDRNMHIFEGFINVCVREKFDNNLLTKKIRNSMGNGEFFNFLHNKQKPFLTLISIIFMLSMTEKLDTPFKDNNKDFEGDIFAFLEETINIKQFSMLELLIKFIECLDFITMNEISTYRNDIKEMSTKTDSLESKYEKKQKECDKYEKLYKALILEKNGIENQLKENPAVVPTESEIILKLYDDLREKDQSIEKLNNEIRNQKDVMPTLYKSMMGEYNDKITQLKIIISEKNNEGKEFKKENEELKNRRIEDILNNFITEKGVTEELRMIFEKHFSKQNKNTDSNDDETQDEMIVEERYEKRIGYCEIQNGQHWISYLGGKKELLLNLPENIYLSDSQFILADKENNFIWAYPYRYEKYENDFSITSFARIIYRNNDILVDKGDYKFEPINNIPVNFVLKDKQVVALNKDNDYIRFYKYARVDAFNCFESIKAKGLDLAIVIKMFPNGMIFRNIETNCEFFEAINLGENEVNDQDVLVLKGKDVLKKYSSKFYTTSRMYDRARYGHIKIINDSVFINTMDGEMLIVKNIDTRLELKNDYVVEIDEFNNFLRIKDSSELRENTSNIKSYSSVKKVTDDSPKEEIEIKKNVLIIGNIKYEFNYKSTLLKNGYKAEVVDGNNSWFKIASMIKEFDIIVVVPSFISHDNMWRLKESVVDKMIIYPKKDGATQIANEVLLADTELQDETEIEPISLEK